MSDVGWFCVLGGVLAIYNAATTRRIWASPDYERSQKIAQTVLVWLVPGSVLVVGAALGEARQGWIGTAESAVHFGGAEGIETHHHDSHGGWDVGGHDGGGGHSGGGDFGGGHH